ncbi:MAG TPA: phosphoribosyltransferase family protein, partial [Solirubrobacterales bacterium]|nr:phosphoribosyltransferase family protein [Solirubrobacterales bacterium]
LQGEPPFEDREDARRRLAERLARYRDEHPVVFALPRGGVPVGYEISRSLGAPLDVFVARKLGAPGQPEFGIGAVAPGGVRVLNGNVVERLGIPADYLEMVTRRETAEVERRLRHFRGDRPEPEVRGRTVILVDDGLATGVTARAAVEALRRLGPRRLVLAAPVCAAQTVELLGPEVDELVCLEAPPDLGAIGFWYRDFAQTSDEEVIELLERARRDGGERLVRIPAGPVELEGDLSVPEEAGGVVLFAHGSGSGRHSPRNRYVARALGEAGLATLLIDLLIPDEEEADRESGHLRFDVGLLARRLAGVTGWLRQNPDTRDLPVGYFGASTGAGAAALVAAAERPQEVGAVVSLGSRPDLAGDALPLVEAPTLLIVGGNDEPVIRTNEEALESLRAEKRLEIVPGAGHLFEEPGTLEEVALLAAGWFTRYLAPDAEAG